VKFFVQKTGRSNKGVRKTNAQNHGYPEDTVRAQPPRSPAYYRARVRGYLQDMELDDWLNTDAEPRQPRRAAS